VETVAVIDIGKTNAKVALVDLAALTEVAVLTTPNAVAKDGPWPHFDTARLETFILHAMKDLNATRRIDAISITTHGACAALIDANGDLAAPVLDYEHTGPDTLAAGYDALRPPFAETGSARLPMGLNLGAQLHWQFATMPGLRHRTHAVLPWPQYWGYRLTGEMAADVTSLGCHTDLWNPAAKAPSSLWDMAGWRGLLPRVASPFETLGGLRAAVATETGLRAGLPVKVGIHDSNASLLPHLIAFKAADEAAFSVTSTGTWVVNMAVGGRDVPLDPARDVLVNVNAFGDPVPSARFMGGREFDRLRAGCDTVPTAADMRRVAASGIMLLPSVEQRSGPFPHRKAAWSHDPAALSPGERMAAVAFYLAMMTDTCLAMTGARGPLVVEGPFAANAAYLAMLASASGRPVTAARSSTTGTALGAALLCDGRSVPMPAAHRPLINPELDLHAARWRARLSDG
jgi:sugar (pentulose or hexulose) kinase